MTSFVDHSVKTDEDLGRRFVRALTENGDTKSGILREAIIRYVERTEGDTIESISRHISKLESEREDYVETGREAERQAQETESRIDDLQSQIKNLRMDGDHDELLEEAVHLYECGADLHVINDKTGKLDKLRKLGSYDSLEAVLAAVEAVADGDDE